MPGFSVRSTFLCAPYIYGYPFCEGGGSTSSIKYTHTHTHDNMHAEGCWYVGVSVSEANCSNKLCGFCEQRRVRRHFGFNFTLLTQQEISSKYVYKKKKYCTRLLDKLTAFGCLWCLHKAHGCTVMSRSPYKHTHTHTHRVLGSNVPSTARGHPSGRTREREREREREYNRFLEQTELNKCQSSRTSCTCWHTVLHEYI